MLVRGGGNINGPVPRDSLAVVRPGGGAAVGRMADRGAVEMGRRPERDGPVGEHGGEPSRKPALREGRELISAEPQPHDRGDPARGC